MRVNYVSKKAMGENPVWEERDFIPENKTDELVIEILGRVEEIEKRNIDRKEMKMGDKTEEAEVEEEKEPGTMPVKAIPMNLNFSEAIPYVLNGNSICRDSWEDKTVRVKLTRDRGLGTDILALWKKDGFHALIVSREDLEGDDWTIWNPQGVMS